MQMQILIKRIIDIFLSLATLILLAPVLLIISMSIKLFMKGPILFKQERVGKDNKIFKIFKFRTMSVDANAEKEIDTSKDKDRTTKLGRVLRRYKLDELPQLVNILIGDMSLVGPRPTIERQVKKYNNFQMQRLSVKPGLTGLAQVNGGIKIPWDERIKLDIKYINNFSLFMDVKIIFTTFKVIFLG